MKRLLRGLSWWLVLSKRDRAFWRLNWAVFDAAKHNVVVSVNLKFHEDYREMVDKIDVFLQDEKSKRTP